MNRQTSAREFVPLTADPTSYFTVVLQGSLQKHIWPENAFLGRVAGHFHYSFFYTINTQLLYPKTDQAVLLASPSRTAESNET